jgi:hypothetical protein
MQQRMGLILEKACCLYLFGALHLHLSVSLRLIAYGGLNNPILRVSHIYGAPKPVSLRASKDPVENSPSYSWKIQA